MTTWIKDRKMPFGKARVPRRIRSRIPWTDVRLKERGRVLHSKCGLLSWAYMHPRFEETGHIEKQGDPSTWEFILQPSIHGENVANSLIAHFIPLFLNRP